MGSVARQARVTAPVNANFRRRGVRAIAVGVAVWAVAGSEVHAGKYAHYVACYLPPERV
jgi:hypothetical protein